MIVYNFIAKNRKFPIIIFSMDILPSMIATFDFHLSIQFFENFSIFVYLLYFELNRKIPLNHFYLTNNSSFNFDF